ncbi:MAG: AAA family ATPase, partial [Alphaproteobacteria bacterium]|nr:AAA family ATPase [Alphaproteobacteria bacterium]
MFLLGPGGVGKSTLGRALAQLLGWPLIDLD